MLGKMPIGKAVSIHTPTKGVTYARRNLFTGISVSIHTPTKGVTLVSIIPTKLMICFNPHTHEGCDMMILENI